MTHVLAIDAGTSSLRATVYDETACSVQGLHEAVEYQPRTTPEGGAEMDADQLAAFALQAAEQVAARASAAGVKIEAVGCCSFWHSIIGVDEQDDPVTPVLLWADTRSEAQVAQLRRDFDEEEMHRRTGCLFHTSYLPARLLWVREERPEWWRRTRRWVSPGDFIYSRLAGATALSTCMASATGLYDHLQQGWRMDLLQYLNLAPEQLGEPGDPPLQEMDPSLMAPSLRAGLGSAVWARPAGDGACSNLGSDCVDASRVALMIGTSAAVRVVGSSGPSEPHPPAGLWKYRLDLARFLVGGALSNGGNVYAWLRRTLQLPNEEELERLLQRDPEESELRLLPFLAGERAPGWRGDARACLAGLAWSTGPEQIFRAGIESVALRLALVHERVAAAAEPDHAVVATGGALAASRGWAQIVADALQRPILINGEPQASARGAAMLALEALGAPHRAAAEKEEDAVRPRAEFAEYYQRAREAQADLYARLFSTPGDDGGRRSGESGLLL